MLNSRIPHNVKKNLILNLTQLCLISEAEFGPLVTVENVAFEAAALNFVILG